jgi:hypothetical protein
MKKYFFIILLMPALVASAAPKCYYSEALENLKTNKANSVMGEIISRETMQATYITPSGNFAVHYDTLGYNAVAPIDLNQNGIPDYIDSVAYYIDLAHQSEVIGLGFPFSPLDSNSGGTTMYDIYVKELADSPYYGLTQPERSSFPGNPNFRTSYIVIDNNFSSEEEKYRTTGIDGLKITLFHEFNHGIQFYITYESSPVLAEMASTFMEFRFFPHILDYVQWLREWFDKPDELTIANNYTPDAGYGLALFFQYTYKKFGDGVVLNSWLNIAKGMNDVEAMEGSLELKNSSLSDAFCEFATWMYFTGKNARGNQYFENADSLPKLKLPKDLTYKNTPIELGRNLVPFTFSPQRVILQSDQMSTNDTLLIFLCNTDYENGKQKIAAKSVASYTISRDFIAGYDKYDSLDCYYSDNSEQVYCNTAFEFVGEKGTRYVEAYPNPFLLKTNPTLHLPAPENSKVYEQAAVEIYTPDMTVVYAGKKNVTVHEGQLVLNISESELQTLNNGFYIFKSTVNNNSAVGKFMVKQ